MVTIREFLKKTKEKVLETTKTKTREGFEKTKQKTFKAYNEILDTEVEVVSKKAKSIRLNIMKFTKYFILILIFLITLGFLNEIFTKGIESFSMLVQLIIINIILIWIYRIINKRIKNY